MPARPAALHFTADPEVNRLLADEPLAALLGMLLDQQVTMEWAFGAPLLFWTIKANGSVVSGDTTPALPDELRSVEAPVTATLGATTLRLAGATMSGTRIVVAQAMDGVATRSTRSSSAGSSSRRSSSGPCSSGR